MKNLIVFLMLSLFFVSCEDSAISNGRKMWKAYLNKYLKDPASLVIHKEEMKQDGYKVEWEIDYGAKNSFGGMKRELLKCTTFPDMMFVEGGDTYTKEELGL